MNLTQLLHKNHQFRLALCGHKAAETAAACLIFMLEGQLGQATLGHFLIASVTGVLTVFPLLGITLTRFARHFANRWVCGTFVAVCALCLSSFPTLRLVNRWIAGRIVSPRRRGTGGRTLKNFAVGNKQTAPRL